MKQIKLQYEHNTTFIFQISISMYRQYLINNHEILFAVTSDNSATNRTLISTVFPDSESNTKQLATTASSSHYSTLSMQTFLSTMHATSPPFQLANKVNYQPKKYAVSKQQLGDSSKYKRAIMFNSSTSAICEGFSSGHTESQFLYSPGYSGNYPNKSDCVAVLEGKNKNPI